MDNNQKEKYVELYNRMFKFCYENYPLAFAEKDINEAWHVFDKMDKSSQEIANVVFDLIDEEGIDVPDIYKSRDYKYTGLNFNKDYKQTLLSVLNQEDVPEPIVNVDDENEGYPIYIQTEWNTSENYKFVYAWIDWREMNDITASKIFIHVNIPTIGLMKNKFRARYLLISTLAHELQHTFDMYILPNCNLLETNKKAGSTISFRNDDFGLSQFDTEVYGIVYRLLSLISPEEISARLAELKSVLCIISANPRIANTLFYNTMKNRIVPEHARKALDLPNEYLYESDLLKSIGKNCMLRSISRIDIYKRDIDELIKMRVTNPEKYNTIMLILGFYMFKHSLLFLSSLSLDEKKSLKGLLNSKENIMKVIDLQTMTCKLNPKYNFIIETVYESMRRHFSKYVGDVHNRIAYHFSRLYNYKKVNEMFSNPDLSGTVILYPVV